VSTPTQITDTDKLNLLERIPYEVIQLLYDFNNEEVVKNLGRGAFLAGGAVRDGLLGKGIKDYDIYFPYFHPRYGKDVLKIIFPLIADWNKSVIAGKGEYDDSFIVIKVWKLPLLSPKNITLDIIFSGQDIQDFDHGICQAKLEVNPVRISYTKEFEECIRNHYHLITVKNLINSEVCNRSIREHTPRILAKYDWPVVLKYV
jgi:hypothetical protein